MSTSSPTPVAVVTGGGTGIGRAVGELLHTRGWTVRAVGLDVDTDAPSALAEGFRHCDVSDGDALRDALADLGPVSALVTCAAVLRDDEWVPESFDRVLGINATGVLAVAEILRSRLAEARGSIVNFASMWSFFGSPNAPAYAASKGAVVALTRSQAVAYAAEGIRANAIAPGWIATPMSRRARDDEDRYARITERIPLGRWGAAEDVARSIGFLVSDDAAYVTGAVLTVDGGYSIA
ncbi:SDR family oxidoreductase [Herbiconiux sp. CPCC 203407]|uniref:SDR family oxidoreductase n=1 Tax=Herbiconiux oxytropis TaxID=2970915 RepID=A0AA41XJL1_9MICO|nr:SDR family oxidoreductase [Herbiconiux oxytropis]MCS5723659.1 SDR family oxidoreductase [Herbiconiux oxytropis]MCS5728068.1 SDR family oxidoreductase [Herbiconiux oxytropis]